MLTDELHFYLFGGQPHLLAQPIAEWLRSSRRFASFVSTSRDKIRKKLRTLPDEESLLDLRLELETAYLLLREPTLTPIYEPQPPGQTRTADFAVSYTTSLTFMIEVTRLRRASREAANDALSATSPALAADRLADAIGGKLAQLAPQRSNVLIVAAEGVLPTHPELDSALARIKQRVEGSEASLLKRYRLRDRSDFFQHYQRLSEVIVRGSQLPSPEPILVWGNPQAKHPLPSKVRTALHRSHTGKTDALH